MPDIAICAQQWKDNIINTLWEMPCHNFSQVCEAAVGCNCHTLDYKEHHNDIISSAVYGIGHSPVEYIVVNKTRSPIGHIASQKPRLVMNFGHHIDLKTVYYEHHKLLSMSSIDHRMSYSFHNNIVKPFMSLRFCTLSWLSLIYQSSNEYSVFAG